MIVFKYNVITGLVSWEFKQPTIIMFKEEKRKGPKPPTKTKRNDFERRY